MPTALSLTPEILGVSKLGFQAFRRMHSELDEKSRGRVDTALGVQEEIFDEANFPADKRTSFRQAIGVSEWGNILGARTVVRKNPALSTGIASNILNVAHASEKPGVNMREIAEAVLFSMYDVPADERDSLRDRVELSKSREETHPVDLIFEELEASYGPSKKAPTSFGATADTFPNLIAFLRTQVRSAPSAQKQETLQKAVLALEVVSRDEELTRLFQAIDNVLGTDSDGMERHIVDVMKKIADLSLVSGDQKEGLRLLKREQPQLITALVQAREHAANARDSEGKALRDFYDATLRRVEDTTTSTTREVLGEFSPLVSVNKKQCEAMAARIRELNIPAAHEEEMKLSIPERTMADLYCTVIAICHQTTPHDAPMLQGTIDGKLRLAWDYLRESWIKAVEKDPEMVTPERLTKITGKDVEAILYDDEFGSRVTDPEGRAKILNEVGQAMLDAGVDDIWSLYEKSEGYLVRDDGNGLINLLAQISAYRKDPVQKKMFYFLSVMFNQGFWEYKDPENLGTPVDYHEARGHLRYGTVTVNDEDLRERLIKGEEVSHDEDIAIRGAIFNAILYVSKLSDRTPNDLHYFFWNVFRHTCRREEMFCDRPTDDKRPLPPRYKELSPDQCVFADSCESSSVRIPQDHVVNTDLY